MDKVKEGINNYITPILIAIIGFFLVQTLQQIKAEIVLLHKRNIERDEWVRDWTEKWQPALYWSRQQMDNDK